MNIGILYLHSADYIDIVDEFVNHFHRLKSVKQTFQMLYDSIDYKCPSPDFRVEFKSIAPPAEALFFSRIGSVSMSPTVGARDSRGLLTLFDTKGNVRESVVREAYEKSNVILFLFDLEDPSKFYSMYHLLLNLKISKSLPSIPFRLCGFYHCERDAVKIRPDEIFALGSVFDKEVCVFPIDDREHVQSLIRNTVKGTSRIGSIYKRLANDNLKSGILKQKGYRKKSYKAFLDSTALYFFDLGTKRGRKRDLIRKFDLSTFTPVLSNSTTFELRHGQKKGEMFIAESPDELLGWITAINNALTRNVRDSMQKRARNTFYNLITTVVGNRECVNCQSNDVKYYDTKYKVTLCPVCARVHRLKNVGDVVFLPLYPARMLEILVARCLGNTFVNDVLMDGFSAGGKDGLPASDYEAPLDAYDDVVEKKFVRGLWKRTKKNLLPEIDISLRDAKSVRDLYTVLLTNDVRLKIEGERVILRDDAFAAELVVEPDRMTSVLLLILTTWFRDTSKRLVSLFPDLAPIIHYREQLNFVETHRQGEYTIHGKYTKKVQDSPPVLPPLRKYKIYPDDWTPTKIVSGGELDYIIQSVELYGNDEFIRSAFSHASVQKEAQKYYIHGTFLLGGDTSLDRLADQKVKEIRKRVEGLKEKINYYDKDAQEQGASGRKRPRRATATHYRPDADDATTTGLGGIKRNLKIVSTTPDFKSSTEISDGKTVYCGRVVLIRRPNQKTKKGKCAVFFTPYALSGGYTRGCQ